MYSALQLGVMSNTEARTDIFGVKTESDIMCMPVYEPITVSSQPLLSHEDYNFLSEANIGENWNEIEHNSFTLLFSIDIVNAAHFPL